MPMVDCSSCRGAVDARNMTSCKKCGAPICEACSREGDGCCPNCTEEMRAAL